MGRAHAADVAGPLDPHPARQLSEEERRQIREGVSGVVKDFLAVAWPPQVDDATGFKPSPKEELDALNREERRVVDPRTGGMKSQKRCQLGAAPAEAMEALGRVYGYGAEKYERNNFRRGYPLSLTIDALLRHLFRFLAGEDNDPESGEPHMAHVAWHALNAVQTLIDHPEMDDRWKPDSQN